MASNGRSRWQYGLWGLLVATTLTCVGLAVARLIDWRLVIAFISLESFFMIGFEAFGLGFESFVRGSSHRRRK